MTDLRKSAEEAENFRRWADGFLNFERTPRKDMFWLDTMKELCASLGNPQDASRSFHVAGSKGKGSVSSMIVGILSEAGYSTGLYASPHIIDFAERIGGSDGFFPPETYRDASVAVKSAFEKLSGEGKLDGRPVTWFELVTAYGMECFRRAGCSWAVYEVGLGGRLDSTNIIHPACCCINRIELEHTEYLGDTLEKIAAEKGGIIKDGVPVAVGRQNDDGVRRVLEGIAREKKSEILFIEKEVKISGIDYKIKRTDVLSKSNNNQLFNKNIHTDLSVSMDFRMESGLFSRPINASLRMPGDFQADNAALASAAVKTVFPDLDESIIERGLSRASLPGRFEITGKTESSTPIILDGAHTPSSVRFTVDTFFRIFGKDSGAHLLFACAADKDVEDIAGLFSSGFEQLTLTVPGEAKASDLPRAERAFKNAGLKFESFPDYRTGIGHALETAEKERVPLLVTGSFYLVSEVKKMLGEQ